MTNQIEEIDLEFFKENENKIVYIQSGFRGYKARKDIEKKDENIENKKIEESPPIKDEIKKEPSKHNISQTENIENLQNANNSKYFESDKEVLEFGNLNFLFLNFLTDFR